MTQIILFRHGDKQKFSSSSNNSIGDKYNSLTPEGINQITRLGSTLKHRFPDLKNNPYIFSSPFTRSLQSAEIVRHILNIDQILVYPNLAEFYPTTDFTQAKDIRDHLYAQSMIEPDWLPPQGIQTFNQAISKFKQTIFDIAAEFPQPTILISTHGGIIRNTVYSLAPQLRPADKDISEAKIALGGYTILNLDHHTLTVDQFNLHDFLWT